MYIIFKRWKLPLRGSMEGQPHQKKVGVKFYSINDKLSGFSGKVSWDNLCFSTFSFLVIDFHSFFLYDINTSNFFH